MKVISLRSVIASTHLTARMMLEMKAAPTPIVRLASVRGFPENAMAPPTIIGRLAMATGVKGVSRMQYWVIALVIGSISYKVYII